MDSENIGESKYTVLLSTSFLSTCTSHDQNVTIDHNFMQLQHQYYNTIYYIEHDIFIIFLCG